ncbi:unnamed protein product [Polarella glacialis]|uniref:MIF4G domain-containing protein n=1 Tax=Polarella glacialis TaxID=89957 RepID=A0A813HRG2_POLGL|nr:unnamed protein product [Polarella glacialis]
MPGSMPGQMQQMQQQIPPAMQQQMAPVMPMPPQGQAQPQQPPTSAPSGVPAQALAQQAAGASAALAGSKKVGFKLKNSSLKKGPKTDEDGKEPGGEADSAEVAAEGQLQVAVADKPAQQEPASVPRLVATMTEVSKEEVEKMTAGALEDQSLSTGGSEMVSAGGKSRISLKPENMVFDRVLMLRIWRMNKAELHASVAGLHTSARPGEKGGSTPDPRKRVPRGRDDHGPSDRSSVFGTDMKSKMGGKKEVPVFKASEKGYKVTQATKREDDLERQVRSLLNKICPDNLKTIVERLATIELNKAEELEFVIRIIFQKALAEPHYCETYADMVFALRTRYPEFRPENEGEKPHTFTRVLLNTCQNEFENLPTTFEATEEEKVKIEPMALQMEMKRRKDKMLANMKFIGNLFLRQLLAVKVIGQVVHDLVGFKDGNVLPEEHMIECVCELLQAIGFTLDATSHGKLLMNQFSARLVDLRRHTSPDGKTAFSKRVQFLIQDLLDLRSAEWMKKLFKEQAKTKEDIRKDAVKEQRQAARGQDGSMFATTQVGVRPAYIDEFAKAKPVRAKPPEGVQKPTFDQAYAGASADGSVVTWGEADYGGNSSAVAPLLTGGVVQVCGTSGAFAAIKADGSVVTWGGADSGGNSSAVAPLLTEGVVQVCGTGRAFAAIKADGSVVTWGTVVSGGNSSAVASFLTEGVVQVY